MRLFVGLGLPEFVCRRLENLSGGLPGARWVAAPDLHLTLRFIGKVDRDGAEDVDAALSTLHAPAFTVALEGLGTFGSGRQIHTLWVGVTREAGLVHLRDKVESALVRRGFDPERRKFKPHVTVSRLRRTPAERVVHYLADHASFGGEVFDIDEFILFRSHLGARGARYERLAAYPLTGSPADLAS